MEFTNCLSFSKCYHISKDYRVWIRKNNEAFCNNALCDNYSSKYQHIHLKDKKMYLTRLCDYCSKTNEPMSARDNNLFIHIPECNCCSCSKSLRDYQCNLL